MIIEISLRTLAKLSNIGSPSANYHGRSQIRYCCSQGCHLKDWNDLWMYLPQVWYEAFWLGYRLILGRHLFALLWLFFSVRFSYFLWKLLCAHFIFELSHTHHTSIFPCPMVFSIVHLTHHPLIPVCPCCCTFQWSSSWVSCGGGWFSWLLKMWLSQGSKESRCFSP